MKATTFPQFNLDLGAGDNPNTVNLPVALSAHPDYIDSKRIFVISRWKFSEEDIERILKDKEIWLSVMTVPNQPTQPPVMLFVENPFEEMGFKAFPAEKFIPPFDEDDD